MQSLVQVLHLGLRFLLLLRQSLTDVRNRTRDEPAKTVPNTHPSVSVHSLAKTGKYAIPQAKRGSVHPPNTLIHVGLLRDLTHLVRRQFQQARVALLGRDLRLDHVDLLLRVDGLRLDFLDEL